MRPPVHAFTTVARPGGRVLALCVHCDLAFRVGAHFRLLPCQPVKGAAHAQR